MGVSTVETNRDRDGDFLTYRDVGESRGLVVKAEDSQLSGCGFKPWHCILDGVSQRCLTFFYIGQIFWSKIDGGQILRLKT